MNDRQADERAVLEIAQAAGSSFTERLERVGSALHDRFGHYTGVYFYLLEGEILVLAAYRGRPTEHVRIPVGEGICGRAARVKQTVTVEDVNLDPDYIACSLETRSEIVVPIMQGDRVLGEIDIDSDIKGAFMAADRVFLEQVAISLAARPTN